MVRVQERPAAVAPGCSQRGVSDPKLLGTEPQRTADEVKRIAVEQREGGGPQSFRNQLPADTPHAPDFKFSAHEAQIR